MGFAFFVFGLHLIWGFGGDLISFLGYESMLILYDSLALSVFLPFPSAIFCTFFLGWLSHLTMSNTFDLLHLN